MDIRREVRRAKPARNERIGGSYNAINLNAGIGCHALKPMTDVERVYFITQQPPDDGI
jgi:hypothetical protein